MPQLPKVWKRSLFRATAHAERTLRGSQHPSIDDLRQIRNFLMLQYESPLGSVVHATPLLEALRQALPDAAITVAAGRMAASVLQHNPSIDRCVVTPNPLENFRASVGEVRGLLRSMPEGPRCVITTVGNQRSRLAILGTLAGDAVRVGYTLAPELYDVRLCFQPECGQIEGNLNIARSLGHDVPFCEPRMYFSQKDAEHAEEWLKPIPSEALRIAFVTQNSGGQCNQWSVPRFQQVISHLSQHQNAVPIFPGTANDAAAIEALRKKLPDRGISLAGKTTIAELAAVLSQCDLVVSLDTGTFHVARAVGLPGVVLAPAWQSPLEWLPVENPCYRVLRGPSIQEAPPEYWIEEVSTGQVITTALDLLDKFPPSLEQRAARMRASLASPSALRQ